MVIALIDVYLFLRSSLLKNGFEKEGILPYCSLKEIEKIGRIMQYRKSFNKRPGRLFYFSDLKGASIRWRH